MSPQSKFKRRKKLIKPRLQLYLVMTFAGLSALALLFQVVFLSSRLSRVATLMPQEGHVLSQALPGMLLEILAISFALMLPLVVTVGILTTFKIAGPLYRFEQFLRAVHRGEHPEECRIRKGDKLQDLCRILNEVTVPLRRAQGAARADAVAARDDRPAPAAPEPECSAA